MKNIAIYILTIITTVTLCSCGKQKKSDQITQTDSAKFEQYFLWTEKNEYINAYNQDLSILSKIEKNRDTISLLNFLATNFESVKPNGDYQFKPADLINYVYGIDFNGDSLLDIIYDGASGGEQNITQLFLNKVNHYQKVFSGYQDIIEAKFTDNRLTSFVLFNPGCCADPQIVEYYYSVKYKANEPAFTLDKTIGYLDHTEKPQTQFNTSKEVTVKYSNAKLRSDCYILDNVEHPQYGSNGNVMATFAIGSKGKALGMKIHKGVEWIYVRMNSDNKIDSCNFDTFKEQPTEIRGWMLKKDITLK